MRHQGRRDLLIGFLLAAIAWPLPARADGMVVTKTTSSQVLTRAFAQRALLWQREGTWELYLQALFDREQAEAAWIVPFPVRPQIHEADSDLLDQLDLLTAPIFAKSCEEDSDRGGCWGMAASDGKGGDDLLQAAKATVNVWERGQVGQLDYVILSATDGDHLTDWIQQNGYSLPEGAADKLATLDTEGQYYFVAKLSDQADPTVPMMVRFVLPGLDRPLYPLRLTALMVAQNEAMDMELFVATKNSAYRPNEDHPMSEVEAAKDATEYQRNLDDFFSTHASNAVLLTYYGTLADTSVPPAETQRCSQDYWYTCTKLSNLGVELPTEWAPEVQELSDQSYTIMRLEGRMDPQAMASDLVLEDATDHPYIATKSAFYVQSAGVCPVEPDEHVQSCSTQTGIPHVPGWFLLLLGWVGWLALIRHPRRGRRP